MSVGTQQPPGYLLNLVESAIGKRAKSWHVPDCGLSAAFRYTVVLEDASKVFVKASTDDETEEWLRTEYLVLSSINSKFAPGVVAWIDDPGNYPVLISEDLSHAYWPASHAGVTWRAGDYDLLFNALQNLSSIEPPAGLRKMQNYKQSLWSKIAHSPASFLKLQLCSEQWLSKSINTLIHAESKRDITGSCLVHNDTRSDNICILDKQVKFVDWSHAAMGRASRNLSVLLPTLHLEGGPIPYEIMPDAGGEATVQAAEHILRLLSDTSMPEWLQGVFRKIISIELSWAASCLNLEQPG